jgi:hypothetical protein
VGSSNAKRFLQFIRQLNRLFAISNAKSAQFVSNHLQSAQKAES